MDMKPVRSVIDELHSFFSNVPFVEFEHSWRGTIVVLSPSDNSTVLHCGKYSIDWITFICGNSVVSDEYARSAVYAAKYRTFNL